VPDYTNTLERADQLLETRGIKGHRAADRFCKDFRAYLVFFDAMGYGSAEHTVTLLENDDCLTDSRCLNRNFRGTLNDLVSQKLREDGIFPSLFEILMDNNGKGVGAGELALPLVLSDYRFSNDSDGVFGDNRKVEIKKNGASLKPIKTGLTSKGLVDELNNRYFQGTVPGKKKQSLVERHLRTVKDPSVYREYFAELYPGCDTDSLAQEVEKVYRDPELFNRAVGRFALREYQRVDGWNNIIYIDSENGRVVNIADPDTVDELGLRFSPVLRRGSDTQAIADGYVNVSI
jgi:hypothetical protein